MKGKLKGRLVVLALVAFVGIGAMAGGGALADESVNYSVRAILPDNQINQEVSYFDLMMAPGKIQVLQVVVRNKGKEDIEVAVEANAAFSNSNGVIEFTPSEGRDPSLKVDFSKIVTVLEPVMTIPAGKQKLAEFLVTMPDEPFEGAVYGGFMFTKLNQGMNEGNTSAAGIRNIYRYVIGARLYESNQPVEPSFELLGASESDQTQMPALQIELRNPVPVIARRIAMQADVYPAQGGDAVISAKRKNIAMAPNSWMPYTLYLDDDQRLPEPGDYRMQVRLEFEGRTWDFETPLVIE